MILVIFEYVDTSFSIIKVEYVIQNLCDTGLHFFVMKKTEQRLGDKILPTEQVVHFQQGISLFRFLRCFHTLNHSERLITAMTSRTFLTMGQTGMQPNFTIAGTDRESLLIKIPVNIRISTEFLNNLFTIILTYQLLKIGKRNGISL